MEQYNLKQLLSLVSDSRVEVSVQAQAEIYWRFMELQGENSLLKDKIQKLKFPLG